MVSRTALLCTLNVADVGPYRGYLINTSKCENCRLYSSCQHMYLQFSSLLSCFWNMLAMTQACLVTIWLVHKIKILAAWHPKCKNQDTMTAVRICAGFRIDAELIGQWLSSQRRQFFKYAWPDPSEYRDLKDRKKKAHKNAWILHLACSKVLRSRDKRLLVFLS